MIALLLKQWRVVAAGAAALMVAVLLLLLQHERHARVEAERQRGQAVAQAAVAAAQAELNRSAGAAAVKAETRAALVTAKGQEAAHEIISTPGADARLPDAVRSAWLAGIARVREPDASDADSPGHPAG